MRRQPLKLPDDIRQLLVRRFQNKHRDWLAAGAATKQADNCQWPLEIRLGIPTEQAALKQPDGVRAWAAAWQGWQGVGTLVWSERRWRALGAQRLPDKLVLNGPADAALWVGEAARWERASIRYAVLVGRWPALGCHLAKHFDVLADYSDSDFHRLTEMLAWVSTNPNSNLYPRQLPIAGLDSKWLDGRKGLLSDLVAAILGDITNDRDFFRRCGLKAPPQLVRLRILDQRLRNRVGGLCDVTAPFEQLANMDISASRVFIVENLQTGLAFSDIPGAIVIMRLGYNVDVLAHLPWIARAQCIYWGDLDTHGFAILNRARTYLPGIQSVLMDEETLLSHSALWVEEKEPHPATELTLLTEAEQTVYFGIRHQRWGQNIRLEQERVVWEVAWNTLQRLELTPCAH